MQFSSNLIPFCSRSLFFFNFRSNDFVNFFSASSFFFLHMIFEITVSTGTIRLAIKLLRIYLKWMVFDVISCLKWNLWNAIFYQRLIYYEQLILPNINCRKKNDYETSQWWIFNSNLFPVFPPIPTECYSHLFCLFFYNFSSWDIGVFGSQSTTESIIIRNMLNLSNKSDLKRFYNWKFNHFPDVFWSTSSLNYNYNGKKTTKTIKRI